MKKILKIAFGVLLLLVIGLYLGIVFLLPQLINSKTIQKGLSHFVNKKSGTETTITGLNLEISPVLTVVLKVNSLDAKNNNVSVADIKNLSLKYQLLQKRLTLVSASNIFIDGNYLKGVNKKNKHKSRGRFEPNMIPEIHITI